MAVTSSPFRLSKSSATMNPWPKRSSSFSISSSSGSKSRLSFFTELVDLEDDGVGCCLCCCWGGCGVSFWVFFVDSFVGWVSFTGTGGAGSNPESERERERAREKRERFSLIKLKGRDTYQRRIGWHWIQGSWTPGPASLFSIHRQRKLVWGWHSVLQRTATCPYEVSFEMHLDMWSKITINNKATYIF